MTPKWILLALLAMALAISGCVYNDDDDNDDGDDGGGATIGGDGGGDGGDDDDASGTVNARGSPGWGLIGSIGAILGVGLLLRRK